MLKHPVESGPIRKIKQLSCIAVKKTDQLSTLEVICPRKASWCYNCASLQYLLGVRYCRFSEARCYSVESQCQRSEVVQAISPSVLYDHLSHYEFQQLLQDRAGPDQCLGEEFQTNVFDIWSWCCCGGNNLL